MRKFRKNLKKSGGTLKDPLQPILGKICENCLPSRGAYLPSLPSDGAREEYHRKIAGSFSFHAAIRFLLEIQNPRILNLF